MTRGLKRRPLVPSTPRLSRAYERTSKARLLELLADLVALQHPASADVGYGGDFLAGWLERSAQVAHVDATEVQS